MARLPVTPTSFKGHQGTPSSPIDYNSIELAVKGTMASPPASINDFDTLVALANWNLLDEQASTANGTPITRGSQPTSYGQFQGFPKIGINTTKTAGYLLQRQGGGYDSYLELVFSSYGRRVGYNYQLKIISWVGDGFTPPEPDLPGSGQSNYYESILTVPAGSVLNQSVAIYINNAFTNQTSALHHVRIEFSQMMSTGFYLHDTSQARTTTFYLFKEGTQISSGIFGDFNHTNNLLVSPPIFPYSYSFTLYTTSVYACDTPETGSLIVYSDLPNLGMASTVSLAPQQMSTFTGTFHFYNSDGLNRMQVGISGSNSVVTAFQICSGGGGNPQQ